MYDLVVLGGGPGGYEAASLAAAKGLSVCMIEKKYVGGTCLNEGCIPLKYYLHASKALKEVSGLKAQGVITGGDDIRVAQKNVVANKDMIVEGLRQSVGAKLDFNKVETVSGEGIIKKAENTGVEIEVNNQIIEAKKLIIATGSVERHISLEGTATIPVIYSSDLLKLETIPEKMVVVGAGVIGLEAASYFADLGTRVTLVDVVKKIGGAIDSEVEKAYERILKKNGVTLKLGAGVSAVNGNKVVLDGGESVEADLVLIAVGRVANVNIGLENTNINYSPKGIEVDETCKTNLENVYSIGDVTGKLMLAHTAYHMAGVAVDNILGKAKKCELELIPQIIYANPEITTVGLTEDMAVAAGVNYEAKSIPMTYSGKYYAEHGRDGAIIKLVINKDSREVLGFSIVGNGCSEIGLFFELAIKTKMTIEALEDLIYPHPTMGEVIKELAEQF